MRRRTKILAGGAVLVVVAGVISLATDRSMPPEPVYKGRPLSQWLDRRAFDKGASFEDWLDVDESIGTEALPWLVATLEHDEGTKLETKMELLPSLLHASPESIRRRVPLYRKKGVLRNEIIDRLVRLAPGTSYESRAAKAILKAKGFTEPGNGYVYFEGLRLDSLATFTNCPAIVLPALVHGMTNPPPTDVRVEQICAFGPQAIPILYNMALAETNALNPGDLALQAMDTNAWRRLRQAKRGLN
jgi:hypothetical protein